MRLVIYARYGGFTLSDRVKKRLEELGYPVSESDWELAANIPRNDKRLLQAVEELKPDDLEIVTVDDQSSWYVHDYDGLESIAYYNPQFRGVKVEFEK